MSMKTWFYAIGLLAVGIGLLIFGMSQHNKAVVAQTWPTVKGQMVSFNGEETTKSGSSTVSGKFTYKYMIKGHEYTGSEYSPTGNYTGGSKSEVDSMLNDNDGVVDVYYSPDDPSHAFLSVKDTKGPILMGLGGVMALIGLGMTVWLVLPLIKSRSGGSADAARAA